MHFSTSTFVALFFGTLTAINALALPADFQNTGELPTLVEYENSKLIKRVPEAVVPPPTTGDDSSFSTDNIGPFDDTEDEDLEPLTDAEKFLLNTLKGIEDDDDDDTNDTVNLIATRDLKPRSLIGTLVKILLKEVSKSRLGRLVWNKITGPIKEAVIAYFKARKNQVITLVDKTWLANLIKGTVKSVLKDFVGSWAAGKIVGTVLPWIVDFIISLLE